MSYASEVPLRIAIKESQRNSDIFSNSSTPSSGTPRTAAAARFDRNASTVFGGSWGDQQQQQQQSPSNGRIDRMASDIFNTNYQSASNRSGVLKNYQPPFLDSPHHHQSLSSSSKRRVTPPEQHEEEDAFTQYHHQHQQSSLDESSRQLDEAYARYESMQNEQLKQASPVQRRQGTPYSHNSFERDDATSQEYESCVKPPSHHHHHHHHQKKQDSQFKNTFADHVPVSAMKRTDHHKHTSIFNDFGSCDSPRVNNAAAASSASMNARHRAAAAPAADFYATMPPPTVPTTTTQASTNRANSVSSNSVFPNTHSFGGDSLQQFSTDVPRSGRRHFQVSSRSSIFNDSNEPVVVGMNLGSASSLRRRGEDLGRNDGPGAFPGSNPNSDHYASSKRSSSVNFGTADGRSGGLSSSDLNRERVGRGRRQAFETSQIFF
ncbi:hypothetical protein HDU77_005536 [Chytriomyces hyalinus]|nr:hypothetical protein HDU77_005536 [Chytriomyces hyalinus]